MRLSCYALLVAMLFCLPPLEGADNSVGPIVSRIPRESVDSTAFVTVGYSRRLRALEIEFHDGSIYRYIDVPPSLYQALLASESKAGYYNRNLRGKYRCLRVKRARPR